VRSLGPLTLGQLADAPSPATRTDARVRDHAAAEERTRERKAIEPGAVVALIDESVLLFRRLRGVAAEVHGRGALSAGRRYLLKDLSRHGPRTVPQLARARSVTRQHVQALVNPLVERGYLELTDNPAHKRSPLVRLTASGRGSVEEMNRRETGLWKGLEPGVSAAELRTAATALRAVRYALEREAGKRTVY
jgi:DNA-binding MarR family transcriptional regulator